MEKLCEAMSESFMEKNPGVTVTVEYTGSGAGLESLAAGSVDIGNASRGLKDEEKASGVVENIVAIDGIAVITNKSCSIKDVTSKDLAKIYTGEITDWAELGGEEQPIIVIGREAGSGTRDAFEELLEVKDVCAYAQELDSTGAVLAKVATTPGAIGYVSLDVVDDTVSGLKIDGVEPTEEEITQWIDQLAEVPDAECPPRTLCVDNPDAVLRWWIDDVRYGTPWQGREEEIQTICYKEEVFRTNLERGLQILGIIN